MRLLIIQCELDLYTVRGAVESCSFNSYMPIRKMTQYIFTSYTRRELFFNSINCSLLYTQRIRRRACYSIYKGLAWDVGVMVIGYCTEYVCTTDCVARKMVIIDLISVIYIRGVKIFIITIRVMHASARFLSV